MKYILGIFLNAIILFNTFGQYQPNIKVPSPNASSLGKYGDIPIGHYTGTANVNIPIYTIIDGDLSLPISISYHSSGIKVSEESSQVGLGWVLNAGGLVSRIVVGMDDFQDNRYFSASYELPSDSYPVTQIIEGAVVNGNSNVYNFPFANPSADVAIQHQNGAFEYEPDQYSFNAGNISGKFIVSRTKVIIQSIQQNLKIEMIESGFDSNPGKTISFKITSPDGTQYLFDNQETYIDGNNDAIRHISSWYLTSVTSPIGRVATFIYSEASINENYPKGSISETQFQNLFNTSCPSITNAGPFLSPPNLTKTLFLDKINFINGNVKLNYDTRLDLPADKKLINIEVYKNISNNQTELLKTFEFTQGYFDGTTDQEGLIGNSPPADYTKRLKLLGVKEKVGSEYLPGHTFEYFEGNLFNDLPAKSSYARDHWGFYNGKTSNTSLIPTFTPFQSFQTVKGIIGYMSGNERNSDPNFTKAFSLKKINYPTGGSTEFEYESNDFDIANSYSADQTGVATSLFVEEKTISQTYNISDQGSEKSYTFTFSPIVVDEITGYGNLNINSFFYYSNGGPPCSDYTTNTLGQVYFRIVKIANGQEVGFFDMLGPNSIKNCNSSGNLPAISYNTTLAIQQGDYVLKIYATNNVAYHISSFNVSLNYDGFKGAVAGTKEYGAGIRVKRLKHFDGTNTRVLKYTYTKNENNIEKSSGRLMILPQYNFIQFKNCTVQYGPSTSQTYFYNILLRNSNTIIPINSSTNGNMIGYDQVTEWNGENGENGKTVFNFENQSEIIPNYNFERPPFIASTSPLGNGKPTSETIYRNTGDISKPFAKIKEMSFVYNNTIPKRYWAVELRPSNAQTPNSETLFPKRRGIFYQAISQQRNEMVNTTEKIYNSNDSTKWIIYSTILSFNSANYLQPTTKTITNSKGQNIVVGLKYPYDFADGENPTLVNKNIINPVIEEKITKNGTLTLTKNITYYTFGIDTQLPKTITTKVGADNVGTIEATISYDASGNPIEIIDKTGITKSIEYFNAAGLMNLPKKITTGISQMDSYDYFPLVGLKKSTDINGKIINYEYDIFNRLKYIKDEGGKIIASYCYNFAGQSINCGALNNTGAIGSPALALINQLSVALPLKLLDFNGKIKGNDAILNWETEAEINTKSFEIEYSIDVNAWHNLSSLDAKGGKKNEYEYLHLKPPKGVNYYRLKMIDVDGQFEYSKMVALEFKENGWVYPNPISNDEKLHLDQADFNNIAQIELLSLNGKIIFTNSKPQKSIEMNSLPTGNYLLKITYKDGSILIHSLLKQ